MLAVALALLLGFVVLNLLAYRHARAMTRFAPSGCRTARPEDLTAFGKLWAVLGGVLVVRPVRSATPVAVGLDHETHTFPGRGGLLEAWYLPRAGDRGLVLLFHGYARCKADLLPEARGFHDLGYSSLMVDFPGCGGSGGDSTTVGYHEGEDVVRAVLYARGRWPGRRLILFGQSMGAAAVLRAFTLADLAAEAAVLECPFDRLLTTVKARFAAMGLPSTPAAQLLMFWGGVQNRFNAFAHNPADYARAVTCPVLLLHGGADPRVRAEHIVRVHHNLAGPKRLHVFPGVGHDSMAELRPEEWKDQVGRFLGMEAVMSASKRTG